MIDTFAEAAGRRILAHRLGDRVASAVRIFNREPDALGAGIHVEPPDDFYSGPTAAPEALSGAEAAYRHAVAADACLDAETAAVARLVRAWFAEGHLLDDDDGVIAEVAA
jgi:hypothetical protein